MSKGKLLKNVLEVLEKFAPLSLAESWDNVGVLIQPYKQRMIERILLTNDLTERVMQEALDKRADMIISYHPPIFAPLKHITQDQWKERILSICLAESIVVYSPHTAWDSTIGGVNDWLVDSLPAFDIKPIQPHPSEDDNAVVGAGRIFNTNITVGQAIESVQRYIGIDVHVGLGSQHTLETSIARVAVCAGSGASVLKGVEAGLFITGEMSHHEILDAIHNNTSVILCNHSNSERGFLRIFKPKLQEKLDGDCEVFISIQDEDPLRTFVLKK